MNDIFGQSGKVQPGLREVEKSERLFQKPPKELAKAEKSHRSDEPRPSKIQEALASTPRTGVKRQFQTLEYRDELKRYREQNGPTEGCSACQLGSAKRHHSYACKRRKLEWLKQDHKRGEEEVRLPLLDDEQLPVDNKEMVAIDAKRAPPVSYTHLTLPTNREV
eukprot:4581329-Heterocapsa_arctica.AAC.1